MVITDGSGESRRKAYSSPAYGYEEVSGIACGKPLATEGLRFLVSDCGFLQAKGVKAYPEGGKGALP